MDVNRLKELSCVTWKPPSLIVPVVDLNDRNFQINVDLMLWFLEKKMKQGHTARLTHARSVSLCKSNTNTTIIESKSHTMIVCKFLKRDSD